MRELMSRRDIGTTIDFRTRGSYEARHPWPAETIVSAGGGIVFLRNAKEGEPGAYSTLFMEVYPPGAAFIRGEGEDEAACEDAAWAKYQLALNCSDGSGSHDWEPRKYRNGAGFCSRCSTFGSDVFTGEQLGQLCRICGEGTTYHWNTNPETGEMEYLCRIHYAEHKPARSDEDDSPLAALLAAFASDPDEDLIPESEADTMSPEHAAPETPLEIPEAGLARAREVAAGVSVDSLAFARLNFAESELWIKALHLVNRNGVPESADPETRSWAEHSFRLLEDTRQARDLRKGLINRPECMAINRRAGSPETVDSLDRLYRLLQAFHADGITVELPDHGKALERFIRAGETPPES